MRIAIAGAELAEVASVGGVGEYALGLARELAARGHEIEVIIPLYGYLRQGRRLPVVTDRLLVPLGVGATECVPVRRWSGSRLPFRVTLIGAHRHFAAVRSPTDIYDRWPNHEPWIAFSRAVLAHVRAAGSDPDVVHCLDSHAALVPVFLNDAQRVRWDCPAPRPATVLTIHNLLDQGRGDPAVLHWAGLDHHHWYHSWFEFYGSANCYKAGLLTADRINTVSRTYAMEICQSPDFGFGLEGVLASLRDRQRLEWVLNGITDERWRLPGVSYGGTVSERDVRAAAEAKRQRRATLYPGWGWSNDGTPVVGARARWDRQKGVVELVECIRRTLDVARYLVVTWGTRDATADLARAWRTLERLERRHPDRLKLNPVELQGQQNGAHHYAVSDFLLIPSWYEPCGLTQMECQRYATIPIVRSTGGLVDTVSEVRTTEFPSPNGFVFTEQLGETMYQGMCEAVRRAIRVTRGRGGDDLMRRTLEQRHSWSSRVEDYEGIYRAAATSRLDEVIGCLSQRAAARRSQGDHLGEALALRDLGSAYAGQRRTAEAREHWGHARRLLAELGSAEVEPVDQLLAEAEANP